MEHILGHTNVCLSGGAKGADYEWGQAASLIGHKVIHWSFPFHVKARDANIPAYQIVELSDSELLKEDVTHAVRLAASAQDQDPPQRDETWRLIHRIYFQVAWSISLYAVTEIDRKGGTRWAMEMFALIHPGLATDGGLWMFDQDEKVNAWLRYRGGDGNWETRWEILGNEEQPPRPSGRWAGVGTRDLNGNGRRAVRRLLDVKEER